MALRLLCLHYIHHIIIYCIATSNNHVLVFNGDTPPTCPDNLPLVLGVWFLLCNVLANNNGGTSISYHGVIDPDDQ
ncbi:MAG: hypothetical protein ACR5K4_03845 [Sodalis sp. (in: enterobacteria)]